MRRWRKRLTAVLLALVLVLAGCGEIPLRGAGERPGSDAAGVTRGPEPTPTLSPEELAAQAAAETAMTRLAAMDDHTLVCQMFLVWPEALTGGETVTEVTIQLVRGLGAYPVSGVIFRGANLETREQTRALTGGIQALGRGMFLAVDEEGYTVNRVMDALGTTPIGDPYSYRDQGVAAAYDNARTIAEDIAALGFNLDFAPVADVWSNPENTVIGERAYSDDFDEAAELVAAAVRGFLDGGVLCTLKHFPGHGDTAQDSHSEAAVTWRSLEDLRAGEFLPFAAGIEAGAPFVMTGHVTAPEVDTLPATLSDTVTTELLRGELGFEGIIITDAMEMGAIANAYGSGEAAVMAIEAGADLVLCPESLEEAVAAVMEALESGRLSRERLEESVLRVLTVKALHHIL